MMLIGETDDLKCRFFKRERGDIKRNLCMADMAIMGVAGETHNLSDDEVIDICLSEDGIKNCSRFQWVEREKDKETLKNTF